MIEREREKKRKERAVVEQEAICYIFLPSFL
jgi:hypothetical protein